MGFDALINHLVEEIALNGEVGSTIASIWTYVEEYYRQTAGSGVSFPELTSRVAAATGAAQSHEGERISGLFGSHAVIPPQSSGSPQLPKIDRGLKEKIWGWLTAHPDILVGRQRQGNRLTLQEAYSYAGNAARKNAGKKQTPGFQPINPDETPEKETPNEENGQLRVYGSEERIWYALTGHGVDWSRIPRLEFVCLSVIAKYREDGILQGDLVRESGQDKRSVPRRTDALHEKGYIEKRAVVARRSNTSRLILKKFALPTPQIDPYNSGYDEQHLETYGHNSWLGEQIDLLSYTQAVFVHLKKQDALIFDDLKRLMGVHNMRWQSRVLAKLVRRLELLGCVRRIRASTQFHKSGITAKGVKFIREPLGNEWHHIARWASASHYSGLLESGVLSDDEKDQDEDVEHEGGRNRAETEAQAEHADAILSIENSDGVERPSTPKSASISKPASTPIQTPTPKSKSPTFLKRTPSGKQAVSKLSRGMTQDVEEIQRVIPRWEPHRTPGNMLFQLIDESGTRGMSTMDLKLQSFGQFFRRPLEIALFRISADWRASQPPNLMHLAVVKDIAQTSKNSHFHYYSYENFKNLVDAGKAIWPEEDKDKRVKELPPHKLEIDEYGFHPIPAHRFAKNGRATLKEAVLAVGKQNLLYNKSTVVYEELPDGSFEIDWGREGRAGRPPGFSRKPKPPPKEPTEPKKPQGRPRKYPKGFEPYKPENKARIKQLKAEAKAAKERERAEKKRLAVLALGNAQATEGGEDASQNHGETAVPTPQAKKRKRTVEVVPTRLSTRLTRSRLSSQGAGEPSESGAANSEAQAAEQTPPRLSTLDPTDTPLVSAIISAKKPREKPVKDKNDILLTKDPRKWTIEELKDILHLQKVVLAAPGVYIDPPGSSKPFPKGKGRGRPRKALIAVFRTDRLRELDLSRVPAYDPDQPIETWYQAFGSAGVKSQPESVPAATRQAHEETGLEPDAGKPDESGPMRHDVEVHIPARSQSTDPGPSTRGKRQRASQSAEAEGSGPGEPARKKTMVRFSSVESGTSSRRHLSKSTTADEEEIAGPRIDKGKGRMVDIPQSEIEDDPLYDPMEMTDFSEPETDLSDDDYEEDAWGTDEVIRKTGKGSRGGRGAYNTRGAREGRSTGRRDNGSLQEEKQKKAETIRRAALPKARGFNITTGGSLAYRRKKVIFDLVEKCGGAVPGERALWYAWAGAWMKENPGSGKPDYPVFKRVQKAALDSGKIKILRFNFRTSKGIHCSKVLLLKSDIPVDAEVVKEMQRNIIKEDGGIYMPPEVQVEPGVKALLDARTDIYPKIDISSKPVPVQRLFLADGYVQRHLEKEEQREKRRVERREKAILRQAERAQFMKLKEERLRMRLAAGLKPLRHRSVSNGYRGPGTSRVSRLHCSSGQEKPAFRWASFLGPADYDSDYGVFRYTTLTGPTQTFHRPSGTFGTDFLVTVHEGVRHPVYAPESLEEILSRARGRRPKYETARDRDRHRDWPRAKFEYEVDEVERWEGRGIGVHVRTKETRFINHTPPTTIVHTAAEWPVSLDTAEAYTIDNPPVLDVPTDDDDFSKPPPGRRGGRKSFRTHPTKLYKTRKLTALAASNGFGSENEYAQNVSGPKLRRHRGSLASRSVSPQTARKILIAVVAIRTLLGGTERHIDWVIIARLFPQYDQDFIQKRWQNIRMQHKLHMDKLHRDFQEAFLAAYQNKELPPLDYDNLEDYDWNCLVEWALENVGVPNAKTLPVLPTTREELHEKFTIKDDPRPQLQFREEWLSHTALAHRRKAIATQLSFSSPVETVSLEKRSEKELEKARMIHLTESVIRANTVTSVENYNMNQAQSRLLPLADHVDEALNNLKARKVLAPVRYNRTLPGRNFDLNDNVFFALQRHIQQSQFERAVAFKRELDKSFQEKTFGVVPVHARDGDMLALNNLLAHGRVEIITVNEPREKWGLVKGYVTRHMDKKKLRFDIDVRPTETYIYGNPIVSLPPAPRDHLGDESKPIPIWYDIHGNFVKVLWAKVLAAFASTLALRPGIGVEDAAAIFAPALWEWEVKVVMEWLVEARVARRLGGGYATEEWFWMVLDPEILK